MYGNTIWDDIKEEFRTNSDVAIILLINLVFFVVIKTCLSFDALKPMGDSIVSNMALWAFPKNFISHFWGIITYMFTHEEFTHIITNMMVFYLFGSIVHDLIGKDKVIPIYIFGGISGGLLYMLCFNVIPYFHSILSYAINIGASAGVMAIAFAATTISPNFKINLLFLGRISIKWITAAYILFDVLNMFKDNNPGGHIAHIGGALFGFIYIMQLRNGFDFAKPYYFLQDFIANLFAKKSNLKVAYKNENKQASNQTRKQTTAKQNNINVNKQEYLDTILDKINKSSYESLSQEEKDFLFKVSQED